MKSQLWNSSHLQLLAGCLVTGMFFYTSDLKTMPPDQLKIMTADYSSRDTGIAEGHALMNSSDCYTCHADNKVLLAPSFIEIAGKYKNEKGVIPVLANKVIAGSVGTWGDRPMPPHPELLREDAQKMIQYILNLNKQNEPQKSPSKRI